MYCYVFAHLAQASGKEKGAALSADFTLAVAYCVPVRNAVTFVVVK